MLNYPIKFEPILKEKIWGGNKLNKVLNKKKITGKIGESWEISDVSEDISVVSNGSLSGLTLKEIISKYKGELVGDKVYERFGDHFPLLIKYIDAREPLSIQLHPNNELALKRHQSFGKTEMWYVMQSDKDSNLIVGFKEEVSEDMYLSHVQNKSLASILNFDLVKTGDVYFIPTGRVHAIGAGVLLAEIQQTSDVTYRIYDWDRKDDKGCSRELHTEEALEAIDFEVEDCYKTNYTKRLNDTINIVDCEYFTTNILPIDEIQEIEHLDKDSFIIYMCVEGEVSFELEGQEDEKLKYGETVLIPACVNSFKIKPHKNSTLLEVYIS